MVRTNPYAEALKEAIHKSGKSIKEIAHKLDIPRTTLSSKLNGGDMDFENHEDIELAMNIARELQKPYDDIYKRALEIERQMPQKVIDVELIEILLDSMADPATPHEKRLKLKEKILKQL